MENAVEIGLIDLYGAESGQSMRFASSVCDLLESRGIEPPGVEDVLGSRAIWLGPPGVGCGGSEGANLVPT